MAQPSSNGGAETNERYQVEQVYSRDQFRPALEENMKAQRAENTSAYNDRRPPGDAAAVDEMPASFGPGRVARD
jgi:hypothetical protein